MNKRLIFLSMLLLFISFDATYAQTSDNCTADNFRRISSLYDYRTHETAKVIFNILDCGGSLSEPTKMKPYVALVGGLMQENPELIEDIYASAQTVRNADAAKIVLDGLWFCNTEPCRAKLRSRPFSLPQKNVDELLQETPPDPFSLPLDSPASIDVLWGYFTATGDKKIPQRIFELVKSNWKLYDSSETIGAEKRLLIGAARWSLVSMAAQHQRVKSVLETAKTTSPEASKLLDEVEQEAKR